jgi:hypothetical protein
MRYVVAPIVVASTVVLFGTGVALIVRRPGRGPLVGLHRASFFVWLAATAVHVLGHVRRLPALVSADWGRAHRVGGTALRMGLVVAVLLAGLALAALTFPLAHAWVVWVSAFHFHDR